eukprot:tig00020537_g10301.t1
MQGLVAKYGFWSGRLTRRHITSQSSGGTYSITYKDKNDRDKVVVLQGKPWIFNGQTPLPQGFASGFKFKSGKGRCHIMFCETEEDAECWVKALGGNVNTVLR